MSEPITVGTEVRVTPTGPNVYTPVVAATADGRYMVAWKGFGTAAIGDTDSGTTIFYQMYDSANQVVGPATPRVAVTNLVGAAADPIAASTANGGFAIAWSLSQQNTANAGLVTGVQFFDATGAKVGSETTISLTGSSFGPATLPFDIVQLGANTGLLLRDDIARTSNLLLFDPATGVRTADPVIALGRNVDEIFPLAEGHFGTVRQVFGATTTNVLEVWNAAGGHVLTTTFGVPTDFAYNSEVLSDGRVALGYMLTTDRQAMIHVIAADGSSVSAATTLQFPSGTLPFNTVNLVAHDDGGFSAIFDLRTGSNDDVWGQRFAADMSKLGGLYLINRTDPVGTQSRSTADQLSDGHFIVAWEDYRGGNFAPNAVFAGEFALPSSSLPTDGAARGDFNGDGTSDILFQSGGTLIEWFMQNGGYQSGLTLTTGVSGFDVKAIGDFNGDGIADISLQSGGSVVNFLLNADGSYKSGYAVANGLSGFEVVGSGDFNGDGTSDLLLQDGGTLVNFLLDTNGQYMTGNTITTSATSFDVKAVGDFNGDGVDDIMLQNGGTIVDFLLNTSGTYMAGNTITTTATGFEVRGAGDFNGDGIDDIVLQSGGTIVEFLLNSAGSYASGATVTTTATGFDVVGTGDYNGDGTSDMLLYDGSTVVQWTLQNGAYLSGSTIATGLTGFDLH